MSGMQWACECKRPQTPRSQRVCEWSEQADKWWAVEMPMQLPAEAGQSLCVWISREDREVQMAAESSGHVRADGCVQILADTGW